MKKSWMKHLALILLAGLALPALAQQPEEGRPRERREIPSPENNARRITKEFKDAFQLTEADYEKVYELYLKQEKAVLPSQSGNRPQGGGGPMGRGLRGGGMGGPGGDMGGFGGGDPQMGGGMPPQGGFQPGGDMPEDMKTRIEQMRKEQQQKREKAAKKLDKKMKKILKGEQYNRWQEWEKERISREETARRPDRRPQQTQRQEY